MIDIINKSPEDYLLKVVNNAQSSTLWLLMGVNCKIEDIGGDKMRTREALKKLQDKVTETDKEDFLNNYTDFINYLEERFINYEGKLTIIWRTHNYIALPCFPKRTTSLKVLDRLLEMYSRYGTLNIDVVKNTWSREIILT